MSEWSVAELRDKLSQYPDETRVVIAWDMGEAMSFSLHRTRRENRLDADVLLLEVNDE